MNNGCYFFNNGKRIDFKIPYYINFIASNKDTYGLCLFDYCIENKVEKIVFTAYVSEDVNAIIEFHSFNSKNSVYINLKQGVHKYVLLNPNSNKDTLKKVILYIPYINNMTLEETKIVIESFFLK